MLHWIPVPLHRALLPIAYRVRHRWRQWRGKPIVGCAIVITNPDGDLLLLRHSYGPAVWGLPGGGVDANEDPAAAIRREIAEELALTLREVENIGTRHEEVSGCSLTAHIFAAMVAEPPQPDGREILEARFFPPQSLPEAMGDVTRARIKMWREQQERGS